MAKTVTMDVRQDPADGVLYFWRVTTSDVEGEGGQERVGPIDRASAYEQLTKAQQELDRLQMQIADRVKNRDFWLDLSAKVAAAEASAAQMAAGT